MTGTTYTVEIEFAKSPDEVFSHLIQLSKWWPEEFVGDNIKLNTEFVLKTGDGHYSKNKVIEFVPNKKIVWLTTESLRNVDNYDWTGTKFIFELTPKATNTQLAFTYDGVVLENEQDKLTQICDFCIKNSLYNFIESFTTKIEIAKSPQEVFKIITADVSKWWGGKDLTGSSIILNDEFIINHPGAHYSKQKLIDVIPGKKIVWLVTESTLNWLTKNKHEWTNTKMIFELNANGNKTIINFTHEGLVPELECYTQVQQGWNMVIKNYLYNYILYGKIAEQLYN